MYDKNVKLDFHDLRVKPAIISEINSRAQINPYYTHENGKEFLPIFTAPMDTVIDNNNAKLFEDCKIHTIIPRGENQPRWGSEHRFKSIGLDDFISQYIDVDQNEQYFQSQKTIYILIDMANGHMNKLYNAVKSAKKMYGEKMVLMVGNIANPETYKMFAEIGVDFVRIGIGNGNACFLGETLVLTKNGKKRIEDIIVGEYVLTHDGTYQEVLAKHTNGEEKELIKINDTTSTKDHEYYVIHKDFKDIINDENIHQYAKFVRAEELTEDYFLLEIDMKKYKLIEIKSKEIIKLKNLITVYDLTVNKNHTYTANGMIVHNCLTTKQTTIGYPMASLIEECRKIKIQKGFYNTKIVADGGMKDFSDVILALAIGADYVMVGSLFNKALESCGDTYLFKKIKVNQYSDFAKWLFKKKFKLTKKFRGMSTKEVQKKWGKEIIKTSEGVVKKQEVQYTLQQWTKNFEDYLRTAMSYTNSKNLDYFIGEVEIIRISDKAYDRFNK